MLREWLQIARSQTAAAVIMLCGMFFLLGGGNIFSIYGLAIIIFSILIHDFSFAHNTVVDFLTGYDTKDQFKKHFPLCNGRFKPFTALKISHIGLLISTFMAIFLAFFGSGNSFLAVSFFSIFLISGFWYNEWTSKIVVWDFLPISICFTSLAVFTYFLINSKISILLILSAVYIFLVEWYEIGVAGEIKEAEMTEEISLLRKLGMICDKNFDLSLKAFTYAWMIKVFSVAILCYIVFAYNIGIYSIIVLIIAGYLIGHFALKLTLPQKRDRNKSLRYMAAEEIISIFALPLILIPLIDPIQTIFLIIFSMGYFVIMNKINWKSIIRPQV
jgi:hypothetical protein